MIMTKQEENKIYKIKKNEDEIKGSNKIKRQKKIHYQNVKGKT